MADWEEMTVDERNAATARARQRQQGQGAQREQAITAALAAVRAGQMGSLRLSPGASNAAIFDALAQYGIQASSVDQALNDPRMREILDAAGYSGRREQQQNTTASERGAPVAPPPAPVATASPAPVRRLAAEPGGAILPAAGTGAGQAPRTPFGGSPIPPGEDPIANWRDYSIPHLKRVLNAQQLAMLPREALEQFENEDLLQIASEGTSDPGAFLTGFRMERQNKFDPAVLAPFRNPVTSAGGQVITSSVTSPTIRDGITYRPPGLGETEAPSSINSQTGDWVGSPGDTGPTGDPNTPVNPNVGVNAGPYPNGVVQSGVTNPTYPGGPQGPAPADVFPGGDAAAGAAPWADIAPHVGPSLQPRPAVPAAGATPAPVTSAPATPAPVARQPGWEIPRVGAAPVVTSRDPMDIYFQMQGINAPAAGGSLAGTPAPVAAGAAPNARLTGLANVYPHSGEAPITDMPGPDTTGLRQFDHTGQDIAMPAGAPVPVARPGRVIHAGPAGDFGNTVVVEHPDGTRTQYSDLGSISVRVGQEITTEPVGAVGSSGVGTGAHLHFEDNPPGAGIGYRADGTSAYPIGGNGRIVDQGGNTPPGGEPTGPAGEGPTTTPAGSGPTAADFRTIPTGDGRTLVVRRVPGQTYIDGTSDPDQWLPVGTPYASPAEANAAMTEYQSGTLALNTQQQAAKAASDALDHEITQAELELRQAKAGTDLAAQQRAADRLDQLEARRIAENERDFANAEAWRRENFNEGQRQFDTSTGIQAGGVTGYYDGAPTLEREQAAAQQALANAKFEADRAYQAAKLALEQGDQVEAKRQFDLSDQFRNKQHDLEREIQTGRLALDTRGQDLQEEKFAYERAQNPFSFMEQLYNARGQQAPGGATTATGGAPVARVTAEELVGSDLTPESLKDVFRSNVDAPYGGAPVQRTMGAPVAPAAQGGYAGTGRPLDSTVALQLQKAGRDDLAQRVLRQDAGGYGADDELEGLVQQALAAKPPASAGSVAPAAALPREPATALRLQQAGRDDLAQRWLNRDAGGYADDPDLEQEAQQALGRTPSAAKQATPAPVAVKPATLQASTPAPVKRLPYVSAQDRAGLLPSERRVLDTVVTASGQNVADYDEMARRLSQTGTPQRSRMQSPVRRRVYAGI